jgi:hypothetical protein
LGDGGAEGNRTGAEMRCRRAFETGLLAKVREGA